ncbi:MAG: hypothetical protein JJU10_01860 [Idiomarina sp.]|nr:hypothetical protein [Idiomarina sp.]
MTNSFQGSQNRKAMPLIAWCYGLMRSVFLAILVVSSAQAALAQERDPIVILGPEGSERQDVRLGTERYGPIQSTDTLWSIASRYRPHSSVTVNQMMAAIVQANPQAFRDGNANEMLNGFYLRIPSLQEVQMLNPEAARRQIELDAQVERQRQALAQQQEQTRQAQQEQQTVIGEARQRAEQAVAEVRAEHEREFLELRDALRSSIEGTEAVFRDNNEMRERLDRLEQLLVDLQAGVVSASEYQQEITDLRAAQDSLRREQEVVRALAEEETTLQRIFDNFFVQVALIALLPLLIVIFGLWMTRRSQSNLVAFAAAETSSTSKQNDLTDEEARAALDRELLGDIPDQDDDDLMSDDVFEGFDDDDGDDLDSLTDEMLVPDDSGSSAAEADDDDDFGVQLDDDEVAGDAFSELDEDDDTATEVEEPASDQLDQDELDRLLAGDDDDVDLFAEEGEEDKPAAIVEDDEPDWDAAFAEAEGENAAPETPKPDETTDPLDPDAMLDEAKEVAVEENDEDIDINEVFDGLGVNDEDDDGEFDPDDIDALLAEAHDDDGFELDDDELVTSVEESDEDSLVNEEDDEGLTEDSPVTAEAEASTVAEEPAVTEQVDEDDSIEADDLVFEDDDEDDDDLDDDELFTFDEEEEGDEHLVDVDDELDAVEDEVDDEDTDEIVDALVGEEDADEEDYEVPDLTIDADEELPGAEDLKTPLDTEQDDVKTDLSALAADEELDEELFTLDEDELREAEQAADDELGALFGEADEEDNKEGVGESSDGAPTENFRDIDEILAEVDEDSDPIGKDDADDDDGERGEDPLAEQLDLARVYMEMGDLDEARIAIEKALAADDPALQEEAQALLERLKSME